MTISPEQASEIRTKCESAIALESALNSLRHNPDFNKLVDFYTKDEAIRLVHLLGDSNINFSTSMEDNRREIRERMIGIARFKEFLRFIRWNAENARKTDIFQGYELMGGLQDREGVF